MTAATITDRMGGAQTVVPMSPARSLDGSTPATHGDQTQSVFGDMKPQGIQPGGLTTTKGHGINNRSAVLRAIASGANGERRALTSRLFKETSGSLNKLTIYSKFVQGVLPCGSHGPLQLMGLPLMNGLAPGQVFRADRGIAEGSVLHREQSPPW